MKETTQITSIETAVDQPTTPTNVELRELRPMPVAINSLARESGHAPVKARVHWPRVAFAATIIAVCSLAAFYWWEQAHPKLPNGIVWGNGRLEADEIDIDTKFAARIADILADEGVMVKGGQVVARMDTRDLEASLKQAQAQANQAQKAIEEANNNVAQLSSQALLAQQEFDRASNLVARGFETKEVLDQRQQQLDAANALLAAAKNRVTEAQHALEAARHQVELYVVNIADDTFVAPRDGRILRNPAHASATWSNSLISLTISTSSLRIFRSASASASPWRSPSCTGRKSLFSTSPPRASTHWRVTASGNCCSICLAITA